MMSQMTAAQCARCGELLPRGAGASASAACPACGVAVAPDVTLLPGPVPDPPPVAVVEPARLPLTPLVALAVSCALMGVGVGLWIGGREKTPPPRENPGVQLPPLLPPAPANRPALAPRPAYATPRTTTRSPSLPPPRVTPPGSRPTPFAARPSVQERTLRPQVRRPAAAALPPAGPPAARPSLKAAGMATVRINNPSEKSIDVTLSGGEAQSGVVGPRAVVDFLVLPGRYNVTLRGASRTQRFYDAPLAEGEELTLVYSDRPPS